VSQSAPRLLLESLLIVLSIGLGFAATEWRQAVADRELADRVLRNVRAEVEYNLAAIEKQVDTHRQMIAALSAADVARAEESAWDVFVRTLKGGIGFAPLREAAWDAAVSSQALRLIDYELTAILSEIYRAQDSYRNFVQLSPTIVYAPATFDAASRRQSVVMMRWMMVELEGTERYLRDLYRKHLPRLQAATNQR
jgi:hypothetical protein